MIELIRVNTPQQWAAYHDIRQTVLFEERGRFFSGDYSETHPDDRRAENHGLLLIEDGQPRGAMRLDFSGDGLAVVRTVAIEVGQQRRGLGRAMMGLVEAYATARAVVVLEVTASCGTWTVDRQNDGPVWATDKAWLAGYLSAYSAYRVEKVDVIDGTDAGARVEWVAGYCLNHPLDHIHVAADALIAELKRRAGVR
jgi:GNAT superfamily N-acetyltransferase